MTNQQILKIVALCAAVIVILAVLAPMIAVAITITEFIIWITLRGLILAAVGYVFYRIWKYYTQK